MRKITLAEFVDGYEKGYITDIVFVKNKIYGKDPRGMADKPEVYAVVWSDVL